MSEYDYQPVLRDGEWHAEDAYGHAGPPYSFQTEEECEAWIAGYDQGAQENM